MRARFLECGSLLPLWESAPPGRKLSHSKAFGGCASLTHPTRKARIGASRAGKGFGLIFEFVEPLFEAPETGAEVARRGRGRPWLRRSEAPHIGDELAGLFGADAAAPLGHRVAFP